MWIPWVRTSVSSSRWECLRAWSLSTFKRLRQRDCPEASLDYVVTSRSGWARYWDTVSKSKRKQTLTWKTQTNQNKNQNKKKNPNDQGKESACYVQVASSILLEFIMYMCQVRDLWMMLKTTTTTIAKREFEGKGNTKSHVYNFVRKGKGVFKIMNYHGCFWPLA